MVKIRGKGTIVPLEKPERRCQRWQLRVSVGRDPITGKYKTKTRRFEGSKTEAQMELRAFINELESGIRTDTTEMTFEAYAEQWLRAREASGRIARGTLRKDRQRVSYLLPLIGGIRLLDLNAEVIERAMLRLLVGGGREGRPLSGTTANGAFVTLKQVLDDAVRKDVMPRNPCERVIPPRKDTAEKAALGKAQARRLALLLTEGLPDARRMGALLALCCGLRRGEVLGLRWQDVDFESRVLRVSHSLSADGRELKEPKSAAGKRAIPIDGPLLERLREWRGVQGRYLVPLGVMPDGGCPVVTSSEGGTIHPENYGRWWRAWADENGYPTLSFHQLRHTYATMLVAQGTDLVTAKGLMGHSDASMLTNVYAHQVDENRIQAARGIQGELFSSIDSVIEFPSESQKEGCGARFVPDLYQNAPDTKTGHMQNAM